MATPVKIVALAISALAFLSAGCVISTSPPIPGSGKLALQDRETKDFDEIDIRVPAKVVVTIGSPISVLVQTDDNLIDLIETRVSGDTLRIDCDHNISTVNDLIVTITVPSLEELDIRGSGDVEVDGLSESKFDAEIHGSGDIRVSGVANRVDASISGSGSLEFAELIAQRVEISISGSGDAEVHAEKDLEVRIRGAGDVVYTGDPDVDRSISGSGSIRRKEQ